MIIIHIIQSVYLASNLEIHEDIYVALVFRNPDNEKPIEEHGYPWQITDKGWWTLYDEKSFPIFGPSP